MKTTKYITILLSALIIASCDNKPKVQENKTSIFKVWGNCQMCKKTIEGSLKIDGVGKANWNTETKMIEVGFDSTKINLDKIQKSIASVGYDNESYKGDDKAYGGLPDCCQYDRK